MQKGFMKKQWLSLVLIVSMVFTGSVSAFGASLKDTKGHWAESSIQSWVDQGLISGYADGTFKPNGKVMRAEFVAFVNRSFGFSQTASVKYGDVKASDWFYKDLSKAAAAGYLDGLNDGAFKSTQTVTRLEAAVILSKLLSLAPSHSADGLKDVASLTDEQKGSIGAVIDAKLMQGNAAGNFRPNDGLTRAEAVVVLTRALTQKFVVYDKPGVYGPESGVEKVSKDVKITVPGVTLRNMDIQGNLTIAESVGNGDVFLKKVSVAGTTAVNGGGANSVHFEDTVVVKVVVNKKDGTVRIVVEGNSEVRDVILESGAKLETDPDSSGKGFQNVTLAETLPADSKVTLSGKFETVDVLATRINIEIPKGQIGTLNVDKQAGDVSVDVNKDAIIADLVLAAVAKVIGQGVIEKATIQANGSSIEQTPKTVEVGSDVQAEVGGKPATNSGGSTTSNSGSGSPSSGTPGTGSGTTVDKSNLTAAIAAAQNKHDAAVEGNDQGNYRFGAKAALLKAIQDAQAVANKSDATQVDVNTAITLLNVAVLSFDSSKNMYNLLDNFKSSYEYYMSLYNSITEGTAPGQAAVGSKAPLFAAIQTASALLRNPTATAEEIQKGYFDFSQASYAFYQGRVTNNYSSVEAVLAIADQVLQNAVEGANVGEYKTLSKGLLELDLTGAREAVAKEYRMLQQDINGYANGVWRSLNKFEQNKITANTTELTGFFMENENGDAFLHVTASVTGSVYAVPFNKYPNSVSDLQEYVSSGIAKTGAVSAGVNKDVQLENLPIGDYKVYHVNDAGQLYVSPYTYAIVPKKATNITATKVVSDGVVTNTISWTDSTTVGVTSYRISRGTTDVVQNSKTIVRYLSPAVQEFVDNDPDLEPGTTYYYWVMAEGPAGGAYVPAAVLATPAP
ncbi:S-layer homology domain-containing protein [Cohnella suwonensis]|uniref:S-layer homology domain-containing protein n=1 Tax=Cohnella suwonensis TaxID=696072 RepID=A0ABW0LS58_9BACL